MDKFIGRYFKSSIISSLVLIVLGVLLIVQSEATVITISYVIGGILIALGVLAILKFFKNIKDDERTDLDIVYGIVCIILGIIIIQNPEAIASIIPFILGFIIIVNSATKLQYSFQLKKEKNKLWISTLLLSLIMAICGSILIFNPFEGAVLLTRVVGIFILIYSVLDIISTFVINSTFKKIHNRIDIQIKDADVIEEKTEEKEEREK